MTYRKPDFLLILYLLAGMGVFVTTWVQAEPYTEPGRDGVLARESAEPCMRLIKKSFPCGMVLPFKYRETDELTVQTADRDFVYEGDGAEPGFLQLSPILQPIIWKPLHVMERVYTELEMSLSQDMRGMGVVFKKGALKLNISVNESDSRLIEPRFFLGVHSTPW